MHCGAAIRGCPSPGHGSDPPQWEEVLGRAWPLWSPALEGAPRPRWQLAVAQGDPGGLGGRGSGHWQSRPSPDCRYGGVCWKLRSVGRMVGESRTGVRGARRWESQKASRGWMGDREHSCPLSPFICNPMSPSAPPPGEGNYREKPGSKRASDSVRAAQALRHGAPGSASASSHRIRTVYVN